MHKRERNILLPSRSKVLAEPVCWRLSKTSALIPIGQVYTVKFAEAVYVLHAFQKKSKQGIQTPPATIKLIKQRLKLAEEAHKAEVRKKGEQQ